MNLSKTRSEHTAIVTDGLLLVLLKATKTAKNLRVLSSALREGVEQREDLGINANAYRAAYKCCRDHCFYNRAGKNVPATKARVVIAVAAIRAIVTGA